MQAEKTKEIHEAYLKCKEAIGSGLATRDEYYNIEDEDERKFLILVADFFLQIRQRENIEKGVY